VAMPYDYDANPARYRLGVQVTGVALNPGVTPLHTRIWELLPERSDLVIAGASGRFRPLGRAAGRSPAPSSPGGRACPAAWRPGPSTFDAEDAATLASGVFGHVQSEWWNGPLVTLADQIAIHDYLVARWVPAAQAAAAAAGFAAPLTVTKRGVLLICRR